MTSPLGLAPGCVTLVPYDERWPDLFCAEAERITAVFAPRCVRLEHVGSTSVPELCTKPIIDILAGVPTRAHVSEYIDAFVRAGYVHRGEQDIPGREFFRRGTPRSYHVHLAPIDGPFWREHLAFRDSLRAHPSLRDDYAAVKHALAARYPHDREAYIEGKGPFVREILSRALASRDA